MGLATKVTRTQETLKKELWLKRQLSRDLYYKRKQRLYASFILVKKRYAMNISEKYSVLD